MSRMASPARGHWTLLYDGDCGVCKWGVAAILAWDRRRALMPRAIQGEQGEALLADLDPGERLSSWHLVSPAGRRFSAGPALAPLLRQLPGGSVPAAAISAFPRLTNRAYAWIAGHRSQLSKAVPAAAKRRAGERVVRAETERSLNSLPKLAS
ncbi:MAG TPA: DCC1-like thiol-disulfide oxidoreductase family protein [Solirubrobacterales bacterium]|nr:DCC1-like thiol-disulfide oxidoreductase family protein [Solirubrobacterales bacterium]